MIFGVTTPLASWNPLWANVQFYAQLWRDARRAEKGWDKLRIWFMRTGWRPADVKAKYPLAKPDLSRFRKFEVPLAGRHQVYIALQFAVYVGVGSYLMNVSAALSTAALTLGWSVIALGLFALGAALENRRWALKAELLRLALNGPLVWLAPLIGLWPASSVSWPVFFGYTLLSLVGLYGCRGGLTRLAS